MKLSRASLTAFTWLVAVLFVFPVVWMVITAFKREADAYTDPPSVVFTPTWEQFAGALRFTQPLVAGSYTVYYAATRTFPATGDEPFPVPPAAEALILTGALVWALEFRAREEWKRGPLPPRYESRLEAARRDYQALQRDLRRRLRTRTVEVSG